MSASIAIRPFKKFSWTDYRTLKQIILQPNVQYWLEDAKPLNPISYWQWLKPEKDSLLFAVLANNTPIGFVYFYATPDVEERLARLPQSDIDVNSCLELSFARLQTDRVNAPKGSISQAIDLAGKEVSKYGFRTLFAYIDPRNVPANRLITAAGFTRIGQTKYHPDSSQPDFVYSKSLAS